ncbi:MAG: hypothetical protein M5U26_28210 [Planctomycetota bacterium]|nr:hypothetical protein [Planctomycetota bacterium]
MRANRERRTATFRKGRRFEDLPMKMQEISGELLNRAIALYLEHAYRGHPERARNVPQFKPAETLAEVLQREHPFEDLTGGTPSTLAAEPVPVSGSAPRVYALRLGNLAYPHMKLALVEAYFADEFVFAVDRHDTFHFEPNVPGYAAWCELKEINRLIKEAVEDAWHKSGVPTLRSMREKAFERPDLVARMMREGLAILVLDDDEARADILKGILGEDGYTVVVGPPGPRPREDSTAVLEARKRAKDESLRLPAAACDKADDVDALCEIIRDQRVALAILDVSYRTGQGPRVAAALRVDARSQSTPILGIYSRRDFGPDPDLFDASLRRPYRKEALLELVHSTLVARSRGGSGIHEAVSE